MRIALFAAVLAVALAACGGKRARATAVDAGARAAAAPDAAAGPAGDCQRMLVHLRQTVPSLVEGDASDLEECLRLPPEVVACLSGVADEAAAEACIDTALRK